MRTRPRQAIRFYSSQGEPLVRINGDTIPVRQTAIGIFTTDTLTLSGRNLIQAQTSDCTAEMTLTIGNYLRK